VLLTRETDYALLCVLEVAKNGHRGAHDIARRRGVSPSFLSNVVRTLTKAGITVTRRGNGGGVSLARPASSITVLEVVEAIQGELVVNACVCEPPQCVRQPGCPAYGLFVDVQKKMRALLDVTLEEVLAGSTSTQIAPTGLPTVADELRYRQLGNLDPAP
jgi:Rrf2 family protein